MGKILEKKNLSSGKWISLQEITYEDDNGVIRTWEATERVNSTGAVVIIPVLSDGRIILIRQFRPPMGKIVYEFPAGLINPGENPEETAVRELKEETGYIGTVEYCSPSVCSSPGASAETLYLAKMKVDLAKQTDLSTHFDDSEHIETFLIHPNNITGFLSQANEEGYCIDSKIYTVFLASFFLKY